jgi:adenylosuccinate lyase
MPHKKNPIICERVVSLARVIRAYALVGMENVPLWHERDLTNSAAERIAIPGSFTLLHYIIGKLATVLSGLVVCPERMQANLKSSGQTFFSQAVMLDLVKSGMDKDRAYGLVQRLAFQAAAEGLQFPDLCRSNVEISKRVGRAGLNRTLDVRRLLRNVDAVYRRVGLARAKKPKVQSPRSRA